MVVENVRLETARKAVREERATHNKGNYLFIFDD